MNINDNTLFRQQCYVDGKWIDANDRQVLKIVNPAAGETIGHVPGLKREETRRAILAADAALPAWRTLTAKERAIILRHWFQLVMEHQEDLAILMTLEQGKPLVFHS